VQDILWSDTAWRELFCRASLKLLEVRQPLARGDEGIPWVSETRIHPWTIHVLAPELDS